MAALSFGALCIELWALLSVGSHSRHAIIDSQRERSLKPKHPQLTMPYSSCINQYDQTYITSCRRLAASPRCPRSTHHVT
eukprot:1763884-Prymnesium_polylepis.4